jgi:hypothetical protein
MTLFRILVSLGAASWSWCGALGNPTGQAGVRSNFSRDVLRAGRWYPAGMSLLSVAGRIRRVVVECLHPDCTDRYELAVAVRDASLVVTHTSSRRLDLEFSENALRQGRGVLALEQTNDVHHEGDAARSWDAASRRAIVRLDDTTPPFLLSVTLADRALRDAVLEAPRFYDYLGPMAEPLRREGDEEVEMVVFGQKRRLRCERYVGAFDDVVCLVRDVAELEGLPLLARIVRDEEFQSRLLEIG